MTDLPDGWTSCLLGSVAEIKLGKMLDKAKNEGPLRSYLRNINVRWFGFDLSDLAQMRMSDVEAKLFDVRDGDVLVCEGGEPGRSAVWNLGDLPLTYQKALHRVRLQPALLPKMLAWQLRLDSLSFKLDSHFTGSTIKHFPLIALQRYPVSIPPLAEQQRIADKLDTVLTRVDAVSTRLARVAPLLKRFRQSVLAAATSGRLTEDWRSESEVGLFKLGDIECEVPRSWGTTTLAQLIDPLRPLCYGVVQPGPEVADGVSLIRVQDMERGSVSVNELRTVGPSVDQEFSRSRVIPGDVLVSVVGTIGRIAVVPAPFVGNIARAVARVATKAGVEALWVRCWLESPEVQWWLTSSSKEVARKTLNLGDLARLPVPIPRLEEQTEIVRRVEVLFAFADRLEARLKSAQAAAGRLTPALLAKAFRGELVPQDPDDEPASELLRRLQAASDHLAPARAAGRGRKRSI